MTRIFREDTVTLDASKVSAYNHDVHGPVTVFKDVVIARAIVHEYDDGMAYKPGKELEGGYWTADGMWATSGGHPNTAVISTRDQIHGRTVNVKFTKSLINPDTKRPMDRGVLADLEVFDNKVAPETLTDMKNGKKGEVSIGFFFDYDDMAGTVDDEEDQSLMGTEYDYVQRNITINHVAFGIDSGRCPMPYCGIGADGVIREAAGDPFGEYKNFADCVAKNQDKDDPEAYCGSIQAKVEGKEEDFKPTSDDKLIMKPTLDALKAIFSDVLSKLDELEFVEDDLVEEEYQGNASSITLSERAKKFFNISDDDWLALTDEEKTGYIGKLPPVKPKEGETNKDEDDQEKSEEDASDEVEEDCLDCDDEEEEEPEVEDEEEEKKALNPDEVLEKYRRTTKDKDYPY